MQRGLVRDKRCAGMAGQRSVRHVMTETESGDGCSDECQGEILCGNGRLDAREECDDGNEIVGDGCDQLCSLEDYEIIVGQTTIVGEFSLGGFDRFRFHADGPSQLEIFTYVDTQFHVDPVRTRC